MSRIAWNKSQVDNIVVEEDEVGVDHVGRIEWGEDIDTGIVAEPAWARRLDDIHEHRRIMDRALGIEPEDYSANEYDVVIELYDGIYTVLQQMTGEGSYIRVEEFPTMQHALDAASHIIRSQPQFFRKLTFFTVA